MGMFDWLFGDDDKAKETVTGQKVIDPEVRKYFQEVLGQGSELLKQPYQPYVPPAAVKKFTDASGRVARFSPDQKAAMAGIMGLGARDEFGRASDLYDTAGAYQAGQYQAPEDYRPDRFSSSYSPDSYMSDYVPGSFGALSRGDEYRAGRYRTPQDIERFGEAERLAAPTAFGGYTGPLGVGEAGVFDQGAAQQYMSPYQQNVTDVAVRKAKEENARQMMLGGLRSAQFGGRAGSGEAVMRAALSRGLQQDVGDLYAKGQQSAYESAQSQFERDRAARLGYGQVNLGGSQRGYELNQATQAQNVAQQLANYQANEQARQGAYGLDLQAAQQNAAQGLAGFQANQQAQQAQAQSALNAYQANLAGFNANQQAQQFAAAQGLAGFQANQQAQQFAANNALDAYRANQQAQQFAAQQNAAQGLAAFQANEAARQFEAQNQLNAAQGIGALGTAAQASDLARLGAQMDVGALKTARRQAIAQGYVDADQQAKNWLTNQYKTVAPIMLQAPYGGTSSSQTYEPYSGGLLGRAGQIIGTAGQWFNLPKGSSGSTGWGWGGGQQAKTGWDGR